jgi:uncharacterized protein YeaO (DUF488 family)
MAGRNGIKVKRAYEAASRSDGRRFLVDGIWPRGVKKEELSIEDWVKDVAPSKKLVHPGFPGNAARILRKK